MKNAKMDRFPCKTWNFNIVSTQRWWKTVFFINYIKHFHQYYITRTLIWLILSEFLSGYKFNYSFVWYVFSTRVLNCYKSVSASVHSTYYKCHFILLYVTCGYSLQFYSFHQFLMSKYHHREFILIPFSESVRSLIL